MPDPDLQWYTNRKKEDQQIFNILIQKSPKYILEKYPAYYLWAMAYKDFYKIKYTLEDIEYVDAEYDSTSDEELEESSLRRSKRIKGLSSETSVVTEVDFSHLKPKPLVFEH